VSGGVPLRGVAVGFFVGGELRSVVGRRGDLWSPVMGTGGDSDDLGGYVDLSYVGDCSLT
jgi:hypothetical protein